MTEDEILRDPYEVIDKRFRDLILPNAWPEKLFDGLKWAEGPVWFGDAGVLLVSDIPNDRILRWVEGGGVTVHRQPAQHTNGHVRDRQGRLVSCSHGARAVLRTEPDGTVTVLADRYKGGRLNSPNDLVVKSDGTIWFTDPPYGILSDYEGHKAPSEQDGCFVYRLVPETGDLTVVADDFVKPNGLAFSPDESKLYIADSGRSHDADGPHHIRVFDVVDGTRLSGGAVFCEIEPAVPDGLRLDTQGNVWSSAGDGIHCFDPEGHILGKIRLPRVVANLTFGGPRKNRIFAAVTDQIWSVYVAVNGAQWP
ncbi:MAG: SMP-30/gluconolactonase/LRE family protein [Alphaproteobacteria bacterium]|jgi:gluconolactonase|nr:SMP-30/gluconolactonase/LRE family protein [Alphaproteobacteria bacterium]